MKTQLASNGNTTPADLAGDAPSSQGILSLSKWLMETGISEITAWRWRQRGWLDTVNISGRVYLTAEGLAKFHRRAAAGEFAKKHIAPGRGRSST